MARPKKLTPIAVAQIPCWVAHGLSAAEIAEKLGCTLGTLRVRCSQLGISLRRRPAPLPRPATPPLGKAHLPTPSEHEFHLGGLELEIADPEQRHPSGAAGWRALPENDHSGCKPGGRLLITLSHLALDQLRRRASVKGISGATLASMLLEAIARDDLYTAVLDN